MLLSPNQLISISESPAEGWLRARGRLKRYCSKTGRDGRAGEPTAPRVERAGTRLMDCEHRMKRGGRLSQQPAERVSWRLAQPDRQVPSLIVVAARCSCRRLHPPDRRLVPPRSSTALPAAVSGRNAVGGGVREVHRDAHKSSPCSAGETRPNGPDRVRTICAVMCLAPTPSLNS